MAAFLSETRERFLKAIAQQVPAEEIAEVYFFAPMKQGGVESGIAVIAASEVPRPEPSAGDADSVPQSELSTGDADSVPQTELSIGDAEAVPQTELSIGDAEAVPQTELSVGDAEAVPQTELSIGDSESVPQTELSIGDSETSSPRRYTVYTARYRLTLKGPERGRWETSVVAEADAPLLTVEAVVRGVQRRAGDDNDPELMSGDDVRAALGGAHAQQSNRD